VKKLVGWREEDRYLQMEMEQHCLEVFVLGKVMVEHTEIEFKMQLNDVEALVWRQIYEMRSVTSLFQ
jgi:hypothetical protein